MNDDLYVQVLETAPLSASPDGADKAPAPVPPLSDRVRDLQHRADHLVRPLGHLQLPVVPAVVRGGDGPDWVVLDLQDDPQFRSGALAIPPDVREHLQRIDQARITFDRLLIGHELLPGTLPAQVNEKTDLAELVPAAREDAIAAKLRNRAQAVHNRIRRAAAPFGHVTDLILDPCLLGVLTKNGSAAHGQPAAIFLLAHWT